MINRFNLRSYGILVRDGRVLMSEEEYKGRKLFKFPGGGVEYGEGIQDTLIREFREELDLEVEIGEVFYVTVDFIQSIFIPTDQVICTYHYISSKEQIQISKAEHELHWVELAPSNSKLLTFEQDTAVFERLCEAHMQSTLHP
ncbi:MAG TPA: NUDIX domain-containing protein [Membranihabitans sp.]|nr:NUDIX domain-containing protein [Membranihabitans sp.]